MKSIIIKPLKKPKLLKEVNISSGYTTFLAFLMNFRFNNSRTLSISALKKYRPVFLDKFEENFNRDLTQNKQIIISKLDDFGEFLNEYKQYFSINGDEIALNDDATIRDIEKILENFKTPDHNKAIFTIAYDNEIKDILKLDGIKKNILKFSEFEVRIEKYYNGIQNLNSDYYSRLNLLLQERNSFYYNLLIKGEDFLYDCQAELDTIESPNHPYDSFYPIDEKHRIEEDVILDLDDHPVEEVLCDIYFYAIFTNTSLALMRIDEDINNLNWHHSFVLPAQNPDSSYQERLATDIRENAYLKGNFVYTNRRPEEELFFLTYVKEINKLQKLYGANQELNNSKTRILYLLDDFSANLLQEDSFEKHYQKVNKNLDEEDDFEWYKVLIMALIPEIFDKKYDNNLTLKKLALISAYYSLTDDKEIIEKLDKYNDSPMYNEYSSFIKGKNKYLVLKK